MFGCDLHDAKMILKYAEDGGEPQKKSVPTSDALELASWIKQEAQRRGCSRIVFAYEASARGFGLYDLLTDEGIECHVLAPTHLQRTRHQRRNKTDEKDAQMILDVVRGHVLAGQKLPAVWVPDRQTRDDREPVRMRLGLADERTRIKNQIRTLAKRSDLSFPAWFTKRGDWSRRSVQWLRDVASGEAGALESGKRAVLGSLVALYETCHRELQSLDKAIAQLARSERYAKAFRKLQLLAGVGTLTAMVFLTEIGDLNRFQNRRQLGAYLGLAPSAHESGAQSDRQGHITRQGPSHLRRVLCQAAWSSLRCSEAARAAYNRVKRGSKSRSKIAVVALMRQLAIRMWHTARSTELDALLEEVDQSRAAAEALPETWTPAPELVG
jgi:transposase